ncbi:MAG: type I polyketide synthase, partial [Candidatus Omnitrophica bacterium]|nr:type I polyketide synthase [Candidatus Omnitrophota bacterium]
STSFKSIVGHTKAAAGVGGLIKAILAVNQRVLPPTANCQDPNEIFESNAKNIFPVLLGEVHDKQQTLRAGVSAAGFGGINCHITLQSYGEPQNKLKPELDEKALLVSQQTTEVFVFSARTKERFLKIIRRFKEDLRNISDAEMTDLAAWLNRRVKPHASLKAAIVTDHPQHLFEAVCVLEEELKNQSFEEEKIYTPPCADPKTLLVIGQGVKAKAIGFIYPGQGSQKLNMTRKLVERFPWAQAWMEGMKTPLKDYIYRPLDRFLDKRDQERFFAELSQTQITQPAVAFSSAVWGQYLSTLGVEPFAVGGHSLGELTALHKAGAFSTQVLLQTAEFRGSLMAAKTKSSAGGMLGLLCPLKKAEELVGTVKGGLVIANINGPKQVIVSGGEAAIEQAVRQAEKMDIAVIRLPVSNAFHSPLMKEASKKIAEEKSLPKNMTFNGVQFYSCLDGKLQKNKLDIRKYLSQQMISPVQFVNLVESMSQVCDLLIEVGPGRVLSDLVKKINKDEGIPCFPVESLPGEDRDLNVLLAQLFIRNVPVQWESLYDNRLIRPFVPVRRRSFIENQCERPLASLESLGMDMGQAFREVSRPNIEQLYALSEHEDKPVPSVNTHPGSLDQILIQEVQNLTGYDQDSIHLNMRLLDDLNLDSIKAGELIAEVAKKLNVAGQLDPSEYANHTLAQIKEVFESLAVLPSVSQEPLQTVKEDVLSRYLDNTWVRDFTVGYEEERLENRNPALLNTMRTVTIVCDKSQETAASALSQALKKFKPNISVVSYEELNEQFPQWRESDCLIAVLPNDQWAVSFDQERLRGIIRKFYQMVRMATQGGSQRLT